MNMEKPRMRPWGPDWSRCYLCQGRGVSRVGFDMMNAYHLWLATVRSADKRSFSDKLTQEIVRQRTA